MPSIDVSDIVLWYDAGDVNSDGNAAIVTAVNAFNVDLRVLNTGTVSGTYRRGVRHVTDPKLKQNEFCRQEGGWEYSPSMKRLMAMEARLAAVEKITDEAFGPPANKKK